MKPTPALRAFILGSTLLAATSALHAADGTWNSDVTNSLWGTRVPPLGKYHGRLS